MIRVQFLFLLLTMINFGAFLFWSFLKTNTTSTQLYKNSTIVRFIINSNHRRQSENKQLLLAVGVLNRLTLKGRRDVIRMTWFKQCKKNPALVKCNFFTDSIDDLKKSDADKVLEEQRIHNDMKFMPIKGNQFIYIHHHPCPFSRTTSIFNANFQPYIILLTKHKT